jgi:hypothetical protein
MPLPRTTIASVGKSIRARSEAASVSGGSRRRARDRPRDAVGRDDDLAFGDAIMLDERLPHEFGRHHDALADLRTSSMVAVPP